jgi:uncharacterized protein YmfQ (DUF2313 family)
MSDRHVRRNGDDYTHALLALLPTGPAWTREIGTVLYKTCNGLAGIFGYVDSRAGDFLERESDPRKTMEMLSDWERNWGLPDECFFFNGGDIAGRHRVLMQKMTMLGGQSRAFFIEIAAELGYVITIHEHSPFMVGISRCGSTLDDAGFQRWEIGPPEIRFYWSIQVAGVSLVWFRATAGQSAIDPHLRIGYPTDLECILNIWKPAHTQIVLDYSGVGTSDPMAGTP